MRVEFFDDEIVSLLARRGPMARDLRFAWEEMPQQLLDEQAQKVRESLHAALIGWAEKSGCGNDYTDNLPLQCLHPVGHWFEFPNMLRNGVLARLLEDVEPGVREAAARSLWLIRPSQRLSMRTQVEALRSPVPELRARAARRAAR